MSKKAPDIIYILSFIICGILIVISIARVIIIGLQPIAIITTGIAFFFVLGWIFLFISTDKNSHKPIPPSKKEATAAKEKQIV
ncbi:MAG TPA: hypothetical protein VH396_07505 [Chitinophagaceae bacterium]|jgi:hypothetical protein